MKITSQPDYQTEAFAWGSLLPDIGSVSAYQINRRAEALELAELALSLAPNDERITNNVKMLRAA